MSPKQSAISAKTNVLSLAGSDVCTRTADGTMLHLEGPRFCRFSECAAILSEGNLTAGAMRQKA